MIPHKFNLIYQMAAMRASVCVGTNPMLSFPLVDGMVKIEWGRWVY